MGFFVCDAEADPKRLLDSNCQNDGGESDVYGNPYDPLDSQAADLYLKDNALFLETAKNYTLKYAV